MTYDHSTRSGPPGPIAGYEWVKTALQYAVRRIPRAKVLLGIPLYGREWTTADDGSSSRALTSKDVRGLIERPEVIVRWNDKWRSPWFEYHDGSAVRTVWFEDSRSLKEKISLMRQFQLRGFAAWRLGDEGAEFWPLATSAKKARTRVSLQKARPAPPTRRQAKSQIQKTARLNVVRKTGEPALSGNP
jgi:spore germination protein YaaH